MYIKEAMNLRRKKTARFISSRQLFLIIVLITVTGQKYENTLHQGLFEHWFLIFDLYWAHNGNQVSYNTCIYTSEITNLSYLSVPNRFHFNMSNQLQVMCLDGQYNSMASLWFQTPEESVRSLFHDPSSKWIQITVSLFWIWCNKMPWEPIFWHVMYVKWHRWIW